MQTRFSHREALARFQEMADEYRRSVGRGIKKLRLNRGWTQQDLATAIDDPKVNSQRVSEWERGINLPQKHLRGLADALEVTENHILAGEPEPNGDRPDRRGDLSDLSPSTVAEMAGRLDRLEVAVVELGAVAREIRAMLKFARAEELSDEALARLQQEHQLSPEERARHSSGG